MDNYTDPQKIDIISKGMQRIENALRDAIECMLDGNVVTDATSLKEALTICELMNPNNHTKG